MPFNNSSFDTVVSLALMEHVPKTEINEAVNGLLRVAKRYVFLQIYVKDNLFEWGKHYLSDPTHVNVTYSKWWEKKFEDLDIEHREIIPKLGIFLLYNKI